MNHQRECVASILVLALSVVSTVALAEPQCREFALGVDYGFSSPTGDWADKLDGGYGVGADVGVAISARLAVGLHFSAHLYTPTQDYIPPAGAYVAGNDWNRYTTAIFGEYRLTESRFSPFVGAHVGMHFQYIRYTRELLGMGSQGDFGLGYAGALGARYRLSGHLGCVIRVQAERAPSVTEGVVYNVQAGFSVFM